MNKYSVRYLNEIEFDKWDEFAKGCVESYVFNMTFWMRHTCKIKNLSLKVLVCLDNNEDIVGGVIFGAKKKGGLRIIDIPTSTNFQFILAEINKSKYQSKNESFYFDVYSTVINYLENEYQYIKFAFPPSIQDLRPFLWNGYSSISRYTYVADLGSYDESGKDFSHAVRKQIRKAQKQSFAFIVSDSLSDVKELYDLQRLNYMRQGLVHEFSESEFVSISKDLIKNKMMKLFFIENEGKKIAGRAELLYNNTAFDWQAGVDPGYFNSGANQLILFYMLNYLKKENYRKFDFGGANTQTISRYKSTFNFTISSYILLEKTIGFVPKLYSLVKKL